MRPSDLNRYSTRVFDVDLIESAGLKDEARLGYGV